MKPILLDKNTVAVIHIFERTDTFDDIFYETDRNIDKHDTYINAAKEFINQLDDHWCISFLRELRNGIDNILKKECSNGQDMEKG